MLHVANEIIRVTRFSSLSGTVERASLRTAMSFERQLLDIAPLHPESRHELI